MGHLSETLSLAVFSAGLGHSRHMCSLHLGFVAEEIGSMEGRFRKIYKWKWAWQLTPVIPATREAEIGRINMFGCKPEQKLVRHPPPPSQSIS
jgi:hypothetical protein